jgi:hypothetical protein
VYGFVYLVAGHEVVWGRLLNTLIGALTVVVLYDLLIRVVGGKVRKWSWWFAALSPVMIIWSTHYLKEALLVLGTAMVANAVVRIRHGHFPSPSALMLTAGAIICLWVRGVVLLPFVAPLVVSGFILKGDGPWKSTGFLPVSIGLLILLGLAIVFPFQFGERGLVLFGGQGTETLSRSVELQHVLQQRVHVSFPFFDIVMRQSGPLRTIGFTILLLVSPVITSLWSLIPVVGNPNWQTFGVAAYAVSWWICLPFLARSLYNAVRQRDTWWLTWGGMFSIWLVLAAYTRFGAGYDAFRYRDAMVPVIILIAARGLDATLSGWHIERGWRFLLKAYLAIVVALILLRGLGLLKM